MDTGTGKSRERYLNELGIDRYAEQAHGAVFVGQDSRRGPSPLELVRWCVHHPDYQALFRAGIRKVGNLTSETVDEVVSKIPGSWMTELSREFVVRLVEYNISELGLLL